MCQTDSISDLMYALCWCRQSWIVSLVHLAVVCMVLLKVHAKASFYKIRHNTVCPKRKRLFEKKKAGHKCTEQIPRHRQVKGCIYTYNKKVANTVPID